MGWGVGDRAWAGGTVLQHDGCNTFWFSSVWLAPQRNIAIFAFVNAGEDRNAGTYFSDACTAMNDAIVLLINRYSTGSP